MSKLQTFFANHRTFLLLFACILGVYSISFSERLSSYSYWMENSESYVVDHVTAMSGPDSYYWLKMARELDKGTLGKGQREPLKGYPDTVPLEYES